MNSSPDGSPFDEHLSRNRSLGQTNLNNATLTEPPSLPRRSQSDRASFERSPYISGRDHDLPPLPQAELSLDARRQSLMALDRKRRLTASSQDTGRRRTTTGGFTNRDNRYYVPANRHASQRSSHSSGDQERTEVIDLTSSSPLQPSRPTMTTTESPRRSSDVSRGYIVPRWQPDHEVSECPICHRQFGFLFRRHHCRKCGRVVCNDCSPHRITIPRQYIVHQPGTEDAPLTLSSLPTIDLTRGDEESEDRYSSSRDPFRRPNAALGGGEKVRLCNPCVPDPQPELGAILSEGTPPRPTHTGSAAPLRSAPANVTTSPQLQHYPSRPAEPDRHLFGNLPHPGTRLRLDDDDEGTGSSPEAYAAALRHPIMGLAQNRYPPQFVPTHSRFHSLDSRQAPLPPLPPFANRPRNQSMFDSFNSTRAPHPFEFQSSLPPRPGVFAQHQPSSSTSHQTGRRPHRQRIREEDICPVCRTLLPAKGEDGDETERENHIMQCITQHDAVAASPANRIRPALSTDSQPSTSLPNPSTTLQTFGNSGPTLPMQADISSPPQPSHRYVPTQMLRFTATEKDCGPAEGTDGDAQECSICMVEYDVGDRLVRLECWCKFHEECIVEWFGRRAECPVHKLS